MITEMYELFSLRTP